jgi:hypothetical protein
MKKNLLVIPRDSTGHALPPPVVPFAVDTTPRSRWEEYWRLCPAGDRMPEEVLF